jgi:carboxypeptidase Q
VRAAPPAPPAPWIADTAGFDRVAAPVAAYRDVAGRIIAAARADRGAYHKLAELTDTVGNRLAGSVGLERAIAWATQAMRDDGHDVRTEPVMVPHWVRGAEEAAVIAPIERPLRLLTLGGSVATPAEGLTAPVIVVHDWDELKARKAEVKGAIVLYDVAMPAYSEARGTGYGETVGYRSGGAIAAAKLGAVAALVRSVTARSLRTPHTGAMRYADDVPRIPAAAVTVEDATLLARLAARGKVVVHLRLTPQQLPDAPSANVLGELRGRERPEEVVVIGAHLDSWDVGQGAHDDGAGCVTMMEAITVLRRLGLAPRRTIRVVLYTNEENGVRGGKGYAAAHAAELGQHVLAVESDSGGFAPRGFGAEAHDPAAASRLAGRLRAIASLLGPLGPMSAAVSEGGTDIGPIVAGGVPGVGLEVDNRSYFDVHHTEADTLDKVDPAQLADDVAAIAVLAYVAAEWVGRLDAE